MMTKKQKICSAMILFMLWIFIGAHSFEKPLFCIGTKIADDGGSGHYIGLGYSFDIEGNFMPEDELLGVTKYSYQILGIPVESRLRD